MKAIVLNAPGGVDQLEYQDFDIPTIQDGEVLVKVKAISINPVDVKSRAGHGMYGMLKDFRPLILGWDISGVVEETKSDKFKVGDAVFGMVNFPGHGKAYAEYVAAPAAHLALKPANIDFNEAAATTLVALTAWQALVENGKVQKGQKVLIHAASGGVGHIAVQIAKYLGAEVTGTSSEKNKDFVLSLGADHHIDYHNYDWIAQKREFDFVLDTIGGNNIDNSLAVTKEGGTVISIPSGLNENVTEKAKALGVNGYFILVHSNGKQMQQIADLLTNGTIKTTIAQKFPFSQMREAHLQQETARTVGKIIVEL
ncbi:NADP-dependent oxidoreductase [Rhizosphaericola mali]|uniref:NADP-dependent oxidoreductase n=1 Tax=Rhizosphaericola mali TaxID=2545455 RepID=A0A5P2G7F3_9BACT|nr:NADP-dependent oxidoreductase [Rhizosphaericola mali]QES89143.1 NADP-dependent oxidoreductase [Rhizosphaericola mali]